MKTKDPLVTVLMPVYNAERFLSLAIESIMQQTYQNFEFLIFDDGSTDQSLPIIQRYENKNIKIFHTDKNYGIAHQLNRGIDLAKGKYIAIMHADDISLPERFERQVAYLETNEDVVVVASMVKLIDEKERYICPFYDDAFMHEELKIKALFTCPIIHSSAMARTSIMRAYKYNTKFGSLVEDYELYTRILQTNKIVNFSSPLLLYRSHNKSTTSLYKKAIISKLKEIFTEHLGTLLQRPASKNEIQVHSLLCAAFYYGIPFNKQKVISCNEWAKALKIFNDKNNRYDKKIFNRQLAKIWLQYFMNKAPSGKLNTLICIDFYTLHFNTFKISF